MLSRSMSSIVLLWLQTYFPFVRGALSEETKLLLSPLTIGFNWQINSGTNLYEKYMIQKKDLQGKTYCLSFGCSAKNLSVSECDDCSYFSISQENENRFSLLHLQSTRYINFDDDFANFTNVTTPVDINYESSPETPTGNYYVGGICFPNPIQLNSLVVPKTCSHSPWNSVNLIGMNHTCSQFTKCSLCGSERCFRCDRIPGLILNYRSGCCFRAYCDNCESSICDQCRPGYLFYQTLCVYVEPTTSKCELSDLFLCLVCPGSPSFVSNFYTTLTNSSMIDLLACSNCIDNKICVKCIANHSLYKGSCFECTVDHCLMCNATNYCMTCESGYTAVGGLCAVQPCMNEFCEHCLSETVEDSCVTCYIPAYLSENKCVLGLCQIPECTSCRAVPKIGFLCLECKDRYKVSNDICVRACDQLACASCDSSNMTNCLICDPGLELIEGICFEKTCLLQKCKYCNETSTDICYLCDEGYYLSYEGGYSALSTCLKNQCSDPNCDLCATDGVCFQCSESYSLISDGNEKLCSFNPCNIEGCFVCSSENYCSKCQFGFVLSGGVCGVECGENCKTCLLSKTCTQCEDGFVAKDEIECQCPKSTFQNGPYCITCDPNCSECTGLADCSKCKGSYILSNGTCIRDQFSCEIWVEDKCIQCNQGYFMDSGCVKCHINCISCFNLNYCNKCELGFFLFEGNCLETPPECQSNQFYKAGSCENCSENCLKCENSEICNSCKEGYTLFNQNCFLIDGEKDFVIDEIYYLTEISNCLRGIKEYCYFCMKGYFAKNGVCLPCSTNCEICNNESMCLQCSLGFLLEDFKCSVICNEGYFLDDQQCESCFDCPNCMLCPDCQICSDERELEIIKTTYLNDKVNLKFNKIVKKMTLNIRVNSTNIVLLNSTFKFPDSTFGSESSFKLSKISCDSNQIFDFSIVSNQSSFQYAYITNTSYLSFCYLNISIPTRELIGVKKGITSYYVLFQKENSNIQQSLSSSEVSLKVATMLTFVTSLFTPRFLAFLITMCDAAFLLQIIEVLILDIDKSFFQIISQLDFQIALKLRVSENVELDRAFKSRANREFSNFKPLNLPSDFFDFTLVLFYFSNLLIIILNIFEDSFQSFFFNSSFFQSLKSMMSNFVETFVITGGIPCFCDYLVQIYEGIYVGMSFQNYCFISLFIFNISLSFISMIETTDKFICATEKQIKEIGENHQNLFIFFIPEYIPSLFDSILFAIKNYSIVFACIIFRKFPQLALAIIILFQLAFVIWRIKLLVKLHDVKRLLLVLVEILLCLFYILYFFFTFWELYFLKITFIVIFISITAISIIICLIETFEYFLEKVQKAQWKKEMREKIQNHKILSENPLRKNTRRSSMESKSLNSMKENIAPSKIIKSEQILQKQESENFPKENQSGHLHLQKTQKQKKKYFSNFKNSSIDNHQVGSESKKVFKKSGKILPDNTNSPSKSFFNRNNFIKQPSEIKIKLGADHNDTKKPEKS